MHWSAILVTCSNKNTALAYEKELKLRQEKGKIDKECILVCVEDPDDQPIGSGSATLNGLVIIVELLCARHKYPIADIQVLKDKHILIIHAGRKYAFDVIGKTFTTLPYVNKIASDIQTNFDLLYNNVTNNIAINSDYGIFICSSDMILLMNNETFSINNKDICVFSCLVSKEEVYGHGVYDYDKITGYVKNIHFDPNESILERVEKKNDYFNLVNGIVYLNFEVTSVIYNLSLYPPINACNYLGLDTDQTTPIVLSLFFDILYPTFTEIDKDVYVKGKIPTNLAIPSNQTEILSKSRIILWNSLKNFKTSLIEMGLSNQYIYMNNNSLQHRINIFSKTLPKHLNEKYLIQKKSSNFQEDVVSVNSSFKNNYKLEIGSKSIILNCEINSSNIEIGKNCFLNDISWFNKTLTIPDNLYIQTVDVNLECIKKNVPVMIVFGINDNLTMNFNNDDWTIMNKSWITFSRETSIQEDDLWDSNNTNKTLMNAKLIPLIHLSISEQDMISLSETVFFNQMHKDDVVKWRHCLRTSLDDIIQVTNMHTIFDKRRRLLNKINAEIFIQSIINNESIAFLQIIRNSIDDGHVFDILSNLDQVALTYSSDLIILPRIMSFISLTMYEMASDLSVSRSGPYLNSHWLHAYDLIEAGLNERAILELTKLRSNWLNRPDLIIRAARHYEGAMQAFIRKAVLTASKFINLEKLDQNAQEFDWIEVNSPARLDLAGAWSDTPPICYECKGSCVTNVAILVNGSMPIGAKLRVINSNTENNFVKIVIKDSANSGENDITLEYYDLSDFSSYNRPQVVGCLVKAVLVFTKLIELNKNEDLSMQLENKLRGSLEIHTWTQLPQGSGLGTSSILIACVLACVWKLLKIEVSIDSLLHSVLIVEQLMTTNGGYQDQYGGCLPSFKLIKCNSGLPLKVDYEILNISSEFENLINDRLLLIYTGITRLAKDLLFNVLRNWYAISEKIYKNVNDLVSNGRKCADAVKKENIEELGTCINHHRQHKLIMAPGSEPYNVITLMHHIEPLVYGMALAGAGGGGFLYIITKQKKSKQLIQNIIDENSFKMQVYDAKVSNNGLIYKVY